MLRDRVATHHGGIHTPPLSGVSFPLSHITIRPERTMPATAQPTPDILATIEPTLLPDGPVLIGTDTTPASDAAFPVAAALADIGGTQPSVVSVLAAADVPIYGIDGMVVGMEVSDDFISARTAAAEGQVRRMVPGAGPWSTTITSGDPAQEITRRARELHARLIVVGRGRHAGLDRMLGGEPVLRLLQLGDTPVLAVEPTLTSPPRRIVIATDFSAFSLYAARVALTVAAPDATIWLVHVGPPYDETVPFLRERAAAYRDMATAAFARMQAALPTGRRTVNTVTITGSAPDALLGFITEHHADLVVSATHGYGFLRRMLLGSVAATLIRRAACSVLVVPGSARTIAAARAQQVPNARTRAFAHNAFDSELAAFTARNTGRRSTVEIDSADLGAQLLGHELMIAGATFDPHADAVALMFGTSVLRGMHLTHTIGSVTGIDLACNAGGEDQVLRIAHAGGQTLVTLH
jgi:nucleotide-binding universal stress UspA family protein